MQKASLFGTVPSPYNGEVSNYEKECNEMKKKLMALLLTTAMLTAAFAGCGSKADSASAASTPDSAPKTETQAPAEPADNGTDAPEAEDSEVLSIQEPEETGYEPQYNFPGSDTAKLHYSNEYTLPISEDGATISWMRTQLNLMGRWGSWA